MNCFSFHFPSICCQVLQFFLFIRKKNFQKTESGFEFEGDLQKLLDSACCDLENILEICGLENKNKIPPIYEW